MPSSYTSLLRSLVADKYFLENVVSEADDQAIFLAEAPDSAKVLVRLTETGSNASSAWPDIVRMSGQAPHPNLLRYLDTGETRIDGRAYDYLVIERIQDRVADVLEERALSPGETEALLYAALSALGHLHNNGYSHGDVRPASIVAASNEIKLLGETVRPLPAGYVERKRAIAADLVALGQTATELLTRQTGAAAVAGLPPRMREFVQCTAGTPECPTPTAEQLRGVLDGRPLVKPLEQPAPRSEAPAPPPPPAPAAVPAAAVQKPAPRAAPEQVRPAATKPAFPRRGAPVLIAVVALIALATVVLVLRRGSTQPAAEPAKPAPAAMHQEPVAPRPSPLGPAPGEPRQTAEQQRTRAAQDSGTVTWAVIAATYSEYGAAAKRAAELAKRSSAIKPTVVPPEGQGNRYYVVLGSASSRKEAERLRAKGHAAGMPPDAYVSRMRF